MNKKDTTKKNVKQVRAKKKNEKIDQDAVIEEEVSILVTIGFTILFILVGIFLGYILYKLALESSASIVINNYIK